MRARSGTTALVAGIVAGTMTVAATAGAQAAPTRTDSAPHFALFGGVAGVLKSAGLGSEGGRELGASGDFRWSPIPVPLRLSISFNQRTLPYAYQPLRGGRASLDMVLRPIPKKFGIQPYFLGGFGVGTHAPFTGITGGCYYAALDVCAPYMTYNQPRQTWAFASGGIGLDVGRLFMQMKVEHPIASVGPTVIPLSVGFRFWD